MLYWIESNTWCPLFTAAIIFAGSLVQRKGRGLAFVSIRKRLIAACSSTTEQNTPRLSRRLVSLAKNPSTAFSQEADVGVKWNAHLGWRASHSFTFGCLWVA